MKTLKRTLTLALVLVMALGLMTAASAADFTDKTDIQYSEAVQVMTGIGAINGYADGSYKPDGLVTRGEAAKMVAYAILGPTVAKNLKTATSSFSDVPATLWSAPYIEYCVTKGIVSGRGNGKFDPNGNVTAYELAKMMLVAAGYGKNNEYVGASWSLNVAIDGFDKGMFASTTDADLSDPATREEAALYIFNAISKIDMVVFSADTKSYVLTTTAGQTIGELKYGLVSVDTNVNGIAGHKWQNRFGTDLSSSVNNDNVIGTSKDGTAFSRLTTKTDPKYIAEVESTASYYLNGTYNATASTVTDEIAKKGVIVNFINTDLDAKAEKVSVIKKTVGFATAAPFVNPTTGAVTIAGLGTFAKDTVVYPADLTPFSFVLRYTDALGITYIEKAASVKGQMTASNSAFKTIVFAGATYSESGLVATDSVVPAFYGTSGNYNVNATAYVDDNNSIIAISADAATTVDKYGLVVGYSYSGGGTLTPASAKVRLYTEDGAVAIYDVAAGATTFVVPDQSGSFGGNAALVKYAINDAGKVTLTPATLTNNFGAAYTAKSPTLTIGSNTYYITSSTKVIYFNDSTAYNPVSNTAKFYTGYSVTAAAATTDNIAYALAPFSSTNLAVIFIGNVPPTATTDGKYAYVFTPGASVSYTNGIATYSYSVYIDGQVQTLTSASGSLFATAGLYTYTVDSNGKVTTASVDGDINAGDGSSVTYIDTGYVGYNNTSVAVTSATKYYQVIPFVGLVEAPLTTTNAYTTYKVTYVQTDPITHAAVAVYFTATTNP